MHMMNYVSEGPIVYTRIPESTILYIVLCSTSEDPIMYTRINYTFCLWVFLYFKFGEGNLVRQGVIHPISHSVAYKILRPVISA